MREIKFRAWDNVNKRFARIPTYISDEGNFLADVDPNGIDMSGIRKVYPRKQYEFAGMSTGFSDKDGTECFEGDFVKNSLTGHSGCVVFSTDYAVFSVANKGKWVCSMGAMKEDGFVISGNIYENPELLKP